MKYSEANTVAITVVGTAAVFDSRVRTSDWDRIKGIARGLADSGIHVSTDELLDACRAHYEQTGAPVIDWPALLAGVRHARSKAEEARDHRDPERAERERLDYLDFMEAVESWDCPKCGEPATSHCLSALTGKPLAFTAHAERVRLALPPPPPRLQWTGPAREEAR